MYRAHTWNGIRRRSREAMTETVSLGLRELPRDWLISNKVCASCEAAAIRFKDSTPLCGSSVRAFADDAGAAGRFESVSSEPASYPAPGARPRHTSTSVFRGVKPGGMTLSARLSAI